MSRAPSACSASSRRVRPGAAGRRHAAAVIIAVQGGSIFPKRLWSIDKTICRPGQATSPGKLAPLQQRSGGHGAGGSCVLPQAAGCSAIFKARFSFFPCRRLPHLRANKEVAQQYHPRRYGAHGTSSNIFTSSTPCPSSASRASGPQRSCCSIGNGASACRNSPASRRRPPPWVRPRKRPSS